MVRGSGRSCLGRGVADLSGLSTKWTSRSELMRALQLSETLAQCAVQLLKPRPWLTHGCTHRLGVGVDFGDWFSHSSAVASAIKLTSFLPATLITGGRLEKAWKQGGQLSLVGPQTDDAKRGSRWSPTTCAVGGGFCTLLPQDGLFCPEALLTGI